MLLQTLPRIMDNFERDYFRSFSTWRYWHLLPWPGLVSSMSGTPSCSEQRIYGTCTAQDGLQGVALKRPDGAWAAGCAFLSPWVQCLFFFVGGVCVILQKLVLHKVGQCGIGQLL